MGQRFDIAVVGGGMVGATAALALARDGWSVVLLDSAPAPKAIKPEQPPLSRVSTLTPAALNIVTRLGAGMWLEPDRCCSFDTMRVWENDPELELVFKAADAGLDELGRVAENELLRFALWQAAAAVVTLLPDTRVSDVDVGERAVRLTLEDGATLECDLLVAADGARSAMREALGIADESARYDQAGLVTTVQTDGHDHTAWQRFLPGGPLAFLPLPKKRCSIVWSCPAEQANQLRSLDDAAFVEQLQQASHSRLGVREVLGPRVSFPLVRMVATAYHGRRGVLVGDAAHVVHPLAGQGANMGLLDAAALAQTLKPLRQSGRGAADPAALRAYARWRRSDNAIMAGALHQIWQMYGVDTPTARGLRLLGARLINGAPWLRRRLIEHASGFGGQVPQLARPDPATATA